MLFFQQKTDVTCGAAAYRMLISHKFIISEKEAVDEVKTTKSGTSVENVCAALEKRGIKFTVNNLTGTVWEDYSVLSNWLIDNPSLKVYLAGTFRDKGKTKDFIRHHAFCAFGGEIYDPSQLEIFPADCYFHVFSRRLTIRKIIILDDN